MSGTTEDAALSAGWRYASWVAASYSAPEAPWSWATPALEHYASGVGHPVRVMSLAALERAKQATGRLKDLLDLAEIAELRRRATPSSDF